MKRFHVHAHVEDLHASITFCSIKAQAEAADMTLLDVGKTTCCCARRVLLLRPPT
jgi:hypothetical protein